MPRDKPKSIAITIAKANITVLGMVSFMISTTGLPGFVKDILR